MYFLIKKKGLCCTWKGYVCAVYESKVVDMIWKMPEKFLCPQVIPSPVTKLSEILSFKDFFGLSMVFTLFLLIFNLILWTFSNTYRRRKNGIRNYHTPIIQLHQPSTQDQLLSCLLPAISSPSLTETITKQISCIISS